MILPAWIQPTEKGFYCVPGAFYLDPARPVGRAVISHGHADHFVRGHHEVHATAATLALGTARYGKGVCKAAHAHEYAQPFVLNGVEVSLWPAGHLIGSAQVLLQFEGERVLFSGDIQTEPDPTCEALQVPPVQVDCLICESTFGLKEEHPDPDEELRRFVNAAGLRPMLIGVYTSGKAQFINRKLNELAPELPVYIHDSMARFYRVYESFGIHPGTYEIMRRKHLKSAGPFALLMPAKTLSSFDRDTRYFKTIASGWDHRRKHPHLNAHLEISGHASLSGLKAYLAEVKPARAHFWHGYPQQLKRWCEAAGILI